MRIIRTEIYFDPEEIRGVINQPLKNPGIVAAWIPTLIQDLTLIYIYLR